MNVKANNKLDPIIGKILVVDDDELNRDPLERRLLRGGHDVVTAFDGKNALQLLEECAFDVVLLDVMMPGISGLQVLEEIRKTHSPEVLPIIMATGLSDTDDVVRALQLGANDYVTKPLNYPIVRARVQTQLSLKRSSDELAAANLRMRHDLETAAAVQKAGLPTKLPEGHGYQFAYEFRPCDELGGDGLNIVALDDRYSMIALWDVSGHGVSSALLSVSISHFLSTRSGKESIIFDSANESNLATPTTVVKRLNAIFPMMRSNDLYFTICYGILDSENHTFQYVCAGHEGPIHVQKDGSVVEQESSGLPVGIVDGETLDADDYEELTIRLAESDRVIIFSDGLTEETNSDGVQFGAETLRRSCSEFQSENLHTTLEKILNDLTAWSNRSGFSDDTTMLAFERESK